MSDYRIEDMRIILYAAGGLSCKVEETFYKSGKEIEAYIDRRAEDIGTFHGKKVYSLEEAEKEIVCKKNCVVIITTKNVFEHSQIAAQLKEKGFSNIIYKDYRVLQGVKDEQIISIDHAFEEILNQNNIPKQMIAELEINPVYAMSADCAYIKEKDEVVFARVPSGMLFTNRMQDWVWSRVNFVTSFLTVELYKEFETGRASILEISQAYIHEFAKRGADYLDLNTDGEWENFVISGRLDVFREMDDLVCMSPEFFINNAPIVKGDSSKGFELISSGKNRVAFLIAKGYKYIPVKMDRGTYDKFIHLDAVKKVEEYINKNKITELAVPILHPFFYKFPSKTPEYFTLWLERVGKDIIRRQFESTGTFETKKISLMVMGADCGAADRYFSMLGMSVSTKDTKNELTVLLNKLFYHFSVTDAPELIYDYAVVFNEPDWLSVLNRISMGCYVAGESALIKEKLKNIDRVHFDITEVFTTFWDKCEYFGIAIRKR